MKETGLYKHFMMEFRELVGLNLALLKLNTALLQTNITSVTTIKEIDSHNWEFKFLSFSLSYTVLI